MDVITEAEVAEIMGGHPWPEQGTPEFQKAGKFVWEELERRYDAQKCDAMWLIAGSVPAPLERWFAMQAPN